MPSVKKPVPRKPASRKKTQPTGLSLNEQIPYNVDLNEGQPTGLSLNDEYINAALGRDNEARSLIEAQTQQPTNANRLSEMLKDVKTELEHVKEREKKSEKQLLESKFKNKLIGLNTTLTELCYKRNNLFLMFMNTAFPIYREFILKNKTGLNFHLVDKLPRVKEQLEVIYSQYDEQINQSKNTEEAKLLTSERDNAIGIVLKKEIKIEEDKAFNKLRLKTYEPFNTLNNELTEQIKKQRETILFAFIQNNEKCNNEKSIKKLYELIQEYAHYVENSVFSYITNIEDSVLTNKGLNKDCVLFGLYLFVYKNDNEFQRLRSKIYDDLSRKGVSTEIFTDINSLIKMLLTPTTSIKLISDAMNGKGISIRSINKFCEDKFVIPNEQNLQGMNRLNSGRTSQNSFIRPKGDLRGIPKRPTRRNNLSNLSYNESDRKSRDTYSHSNVETNDENNDEKVISSILKKAVTRRANARRSNVRRANARHANAIQDKATIAKIQTLLRNKGTGF